jgi:hypothetical protein
MAGGEGKRRGREGVGGVGGVGMWFGKGGWEGVGGGTGGKEDSGEVKRKKKRK